MEYPDFEIAALPARRSHWETLRNLAGHLWPRGQFELRLRVVLAMGCLVAAKVINVYVPFLYKGVVDALTPEGLLLALPLGLIVAYGGTRVLPLAFGELRDFVFAKVGHHAQRNVALQTFQHLHGLSHAFHLERQTGGLSRVIDRGTKGIEAVLSFMLFNILPTLVEILLVAAVLFFHFGWLYALVTLVTVGGYIVFTMVVTNWRLKYRQEMNHSDAQANTRAIDSLLNFETVKAFSNEDHEFDRFDRGLAAYESAAVRSQTSLTLLNVGQGVTIGIGLVIVMGMAAKGVAAGQNTLGDFVMVNTYLIQLFLPLNFLGYVYREVKESLTDMEKMFELLRIKADILDRPGAQPLEGKAGEVEFDHVSFAYTPERSILRDVSFRIPAGQTVAVVGASGAGKTTLSRLLFRFYEVTSGSIRIDGQDLRDITLRSLRTAIGMVPQDTVLFNDTIEYNIRYGRPDASAEDVRHAAGLAEIQRFVDELPDGFETMVGERGLKLSGGEKQRVAIARTIIKDPLILLFDEATSALDSHTEKDIQASLREVSQHRTTLVIAHRLSTIVDADQILVLQDGRIVERGIHAALLAEGGVYASMWMRQQEAESLRDRITLAAG